VAVRPKANVSLFDVRRSEASQRRSLDTVKTVNMLQFMTPYVKFQITVATHIGAKEDLKTTGHNALRSYETKNFL
jgi:hypothetical protein